ncbi:Rrf2 family transcriptional regulator [Ruminococcus sp. NK3A76]|uniref:RrF2 family transcriptional regulator n=1 Tax=Ruminococcus sp. NK3A76 TaxID=877411 RepID=UPI00048A60F5|nr:Rrf2 family transcriptional regulator [Ruminococcus sp. NK3A76]
MKISTKGRYALRLMYDMAVNDTGSAMPLKDVAHRQNISVKYLEQIVILLNRAGYVKSVRGAQGGYRLAHEPEFYTVGMILRLTEGSMAPVSCLDDETNQCPRATECPTLFVWEKLNDAVKGVIDTITLRDIIEHNMEKTIDYTI